jgi:N-hydroxyarylamine O-acetyltransferase
MEPSLLNALDRQATTSPLVAFDLDAYCARINYTGSRDPNLATLKGLHSAHAHTVPFENPDIHLGRAISLDPSTLFAKIVTRKRGGYCYEVNSFFAMILRAFGFQVQCLLARVLYGFSNFRPRSHQLLLISVENQSWIADVGFGSCCLREPMRLTPDEVSAQGPDSFRLKTETGHTYILEALLAGRWQDLYGFTLEPFDLVDYEPFNFWNSTSPQVRFTQQKLCTIPTPEGRVVAVDMDFKIHGRQGTQTITAKTHEEYLKLLRAHFGLEIAGTFIK